MNGRYAVGQHIPTFVGLFPAEHPQFVILVKIDNPRGAYVGGLTAAPVTKAVLEAALASRSAALDRGSLAAARRERSVVATPPGAAPGRRAADGADAVTGALRETVTSPDTVAPDDDSAGTAPFVALLPEPLPPQVPAPAPRRVPDIRGLDARHTALALHGAGFRVQLAGGPPGTTSPVAGTMLPAGAVVHMAAP